MTRKFILNALPEEWLLSSIFSSGLSGGDRGDKRGEDRRIRGSMRS
jgi:hypothetical protein